MKTPRAKTKPAAFTERDRDKASCAHACARLVTHIRYLESRRRGSRAAFLVRKADSEDAFEITVRRVQTPAPRRQRLL